MKRAFWVRLDRVARDLTPILLTIALVILNHVPLHIPGLSRVVPVLALISVFHWAIYRPDLLPVYTVFLVGVLNDILGGAALGVWALVFVLVYGISVPQRRFFVGKSFLLVWLGFTVLAAAAIALAWLANVVVSGSVMDTRAPIFQYLMTVGFYGPIGYAFMRWQRALLAWD